MKNLLIYRVQDHIKKNDNAHVEQKNGDKIRNIVGYFRYDTVFEVSLLNKI